MAESESKSNSEDTETAEDNNNDASEETSQDLDEVERKKKEIEIEKAEEAKLTSKYPSVQNAGQSQLLQKRLSKGIRFFDSGDYYVAKAKTAGASGGGVPGSKPTMLIGQTGEAIPKPELIPHKKVGPQQSKLAGTS